MSKKDLIIRWSFTVAIGVTIVLGIIAGFLLQLNTYGRPVIPWNVIHAFNYTVGFFTFIDVVTGVLLCLNLHEEAKRNAN